MGIIAKVLILLLSATAGFLYVVVDRRHGVAPRATAPAAAAARPGRVRKGAVVAAGRSGKSSKTEATQRRGLAAEKSASSVKSKISKSSKITLKSANASKPSKCLEHETVVTVRVRTDAHPKETSWMLVDACVNDESRSHAPYLAASTDYEDVFCLNPAEFVFTIADTYGDGICCNSGDGSYTVLMDGEVMAEGGIFGETKVETFGACGEMAKGMYDPSGKTSRTEARGIEDSVASDVAAAGRSGKSSKTEARGIDDSVASDVAAAGHSGKSSKIEARGIEDSVAPAGDALVVDLFTLRFSFAPRDACVDPAAGDGHVAGAQPGQCAQACAVLASCVGFAHLPETGACVLVNADPEECDGSDPNAVFYERSVVMHFDD